MCRQINPAEKEKLEKMIRNLGKAKNILEGKGDPFLTSYRTPEAIKNINEVITYLEEKESETKKEKDSEYPDLSGPETS